MALKHRLMRDAMYRYAKKVGYACTADEMINNSTLLNGKIVKDARCCGPKNSRQISSILSRDPRFMMVGKTKSGLGHPLTLWEAVE